MAMHANDAPSAWNYMAGRWLAGNPPILGPLSHAMWMSSVAFDGARAFEGVAPDLELHCARCLHSARVLGLEPMVSAGEMVELAWDGIARFPRGAALYIRPMFFAESGWVEPDPSSTGFCLTLTVSPLPGTAGLKTCLSTRRRPLPDSAPTDAKASCLYPNVGLALRDARQRGFDNAVMLDPLGAVAEFATANLFMVKDGIVHTPACNGTFLNGITRQRIIHLLRGAGHEVCERTITVRELREADEFFATGNYGKVQPVVQFEDVTREPGPVAAAARALYWDFAHRRQSCAA